MQHYQQRAIAVYDPEKGSKVKRLSINNVRTMSFSCRRPDGPSKCSSRNQSIVSRLALGLGILRVARKKSRYSLRDLPARRKCSRVTFFDDSRDLLRFRMVLLCRLRQSARIVFDTLLAMKPNMAMCTGGGKKRLKSCTCEKLIYA